MGDSAGTFTVPLIINGEEHYPDKKFDVTSPATGKVVHNCGSASVDDAAVAVDAAAKAFSSWRKITPSQRRDLFLRAAEVMRNRREELVQYMKDETAGTEHWCNFNIDAAIDFITDVAGRIATLEGTFPTTRDPKVSSIVLQEPYGVVLSIAPWNAPYILGTRAVAFPLAAGNTVVFKASELSPRTLGAIVSVFQEAGIPKGVLNFIAHDPASAADVTAALIRNPLIKKINFTGSTNVGRIIGRLAGENLKPVILELGGKAPAIVWEDADLQLAADSCTLGSFANAGQVCMSTEKILVHKSIKSAFEEKLRGSIEKFFSSQGEAPILISPAAVEKTKKLVDEAVAAGASVVVGDPNAKESSGTRMRPVVLGNITQQMSIYRTESFGPAVSIIEIETEEEAIEVANDTEYGLSSAVYTEDLRRGLRFAREIEAGAVHINSMSIHDESVLPHGGAKASGYGRFNSTIGLTEWVRTKTVTFPN